MSWTKEEISKFTLREIKEINSSDNELIDLLLDDSRKSVRAYAKTLQKKNSIHAFTKSLYENDRALVNDNELVVGMDEVGRGSLAGPVVVAACLLPADETLIIDGVNDSKKLSAKKRKKFAEKLRETSLDFSIGIVSSKEIDRIGINAAVNKAMNMAAAKLNIKPDLYIIDEPNRGFKNNILQTDVRQLRKIKADENHYSVAAASIIAKEFRDSYMTKLSDNFSQYCFEKNKGYGTEEHLKAIREFGLTPIHRSCFCKNLYREKIE